VIPADLVAEAEKVAADGVAAAEAASSTDELNEVDRVYLGKSSPFNGLRARIKELDGPDKAAFGQLVNEKRGAVERAVTARRETLVAQEAEGAAVRDRVDLTLGGRDYQRGHMHPVTRIWRELEDVFVGLGYKVAEGPEVELDWYNFEALNFPPGHPARAMQDTLYVKLGEPEQVLLRTHTSPVQVRTMEAEKPPIYVVAPGRVFRRDTPDARHSPVFHQIEALVVDRGITMADLMGTIETFIHALFGDDVRTRFLPSFFPFTEPSAELSFSCPFCTTGCRVCSHTGWIELGGCGMVDPNVFEAVGIDPEEWSGFAFGFGIDRIPLLRNEIDTLNTLLWDNDIRFLSQF
jgi:phenylalanyl-tRNA synthetase alpha chain